MGGAIAATSKSDGYERWRAEDDLRTLAEAKKIEKDETRMKHVRRCAKEKLAEMAQLKSLAEGK